MNQLRLRWVMLVFTLVGPIIMLALMKLTMIVRPFTIIYIDKAATLTGLTTPFRQYDARTWCPGIKPGALINSPLNPILFEFTP